MHNGVLVSQDIRELIENRVITADSPIDEKQIQPASLDLRLGDEAFEVRDSFLPRRGQSIEQILEREKLRRFNLDGSQEFQSGRVYVVPLRESLDLIPDVEGKVNPKSSVGRVDLFVRLVVDGYPVFDRVPKNYKGKLYAIVIPQAFNVIAHPGVTLNQLRLCQGNARLNDFALNLALRRHKLIYHGDLPATTEVTVDNGIYLSVQVNEGFAAYKAKKTKKPIDLSKEGFYEQSDFFDKVESKDGRIIIEKNSFYLLAAREKVRIPAELAAELEAVSVIFGDFRAHYAGFFDPGHGYGEDGSILGSLPTLEVRSMGHRFILEDHQFVCRIVYERVSRRPDKIYGVKTQAHYQAQRGIKLAKYFRA